MGLEVYVCVDDKTDIIEIREMKINFLGCFDADSFTKPPGANFRSMFSFNIYPWY